MWIAKQLGNDRVHGRRCQIHIRYVKYLMLQSGANVYCSDGWIVSFSTSYFEQSTAVVVTFAWVQFVQVFQRRFIGKVAFHTRTWNKYAEGFGDIDTEFWLGKQLQCFMVVSTSTKRHRVLKKCLFDKLMHPHFGWRGILSQYLVCINCWSWFQTDN